MPHLPDEGYVKYRCFHSLGLPHDKEQINEINAIRSELWRLQLIGVYDNGIGFGNISTRLEAPAGDGKFIISGTQTGQYPDLETQHYATVTGYNIAENTVSCRGMVKASSEALTHAAVYEADATCRVVIHIHHLLTWQNRLNQLPTTKADVPYGTPEMANEILRLFRQSDLPQTKVLVMAGHPEGLIAFGSSGAEAYSLLMAQIVGV